MPIDWENYHSYPRDLGTLGSNPSLWYSVAIAINNNGDVLGQSSIGPGENNKEGAFQNVPLHAVIFRGGRIIDLGLPPGELDPARTWVWPAGMNDNGDVVGMCDNNPWLYHDGKMSNLITPGYQITYVGGINNSGQIAANQNGDTLLLTPVDTKSAIRP